MNEITLNINNELPLVASGEAHLKPRVFPPSQIAPFLKPARPVKRSRDGGHEEHFHTPP